MIIGIDLGTTNSLVTAFKNGVNVLIPNKYGELLTPSVVGVDENNELIVGKVAKERLITAPELTTSLFKRKMGRDSKVKLGEKEFLPEELSSFIIKKLIADAELFLAEKISEAVISVPAYFNSKQRAATKKAGQLAGIKVERLVNEPSAAAIACLDENEDDTFIVFDFGGGTLDVSVVEKFDNVINICAISGDNLLGGRDFDLAIYRAFCAEFDLSANKLSKQEQQTILRIAEKAKIELQEREEVLLKAIINNKALTMTLTNDKLSKLSNDIFKRLRKPIVNAMKDSGLEASDISKLILVGGSCQMTIVKNYLKKLLRIPIVNNNNVDQIVASGLGIYVGIKQRSQEVKNLVLTDICPFSLSVGALDFSGRYVASSMIPRNSVLPTSITKDFYTSQPGQTEVDLNIYQGEEMYADDNLLLGKLRLNVPKNLIEAERIDVTFYYDINSILVVRALAKSTGKIFSYILGGDGLELKGEDSKKYLEQHQNIDLKFASHRRQTFLLEKAKRIYSESSGSIKSYMEILIANIEDVLNTSSLRKLNEILDEYEGILEAVEKEESNIDLFRDLDEELELEEDSDPDSDFDGFIS